MDQVPEGQTEGGAPLLRHLQEEHRRYSQQLESLLSKRYLSEDEKIEEVRLKKLKLHLKDQIFGIQSVERSPLPMT